MFPKLVIQLNEMSNIKFVTQLIEMINIKFTLQIMTFEQAREHPFNPFDITKVFAIAVIRSIRNLEMQS